MDITQEILSDITVYNKYAKYLPELQRRETWNEIVTRNKEMHQKKFPQLSKEIEEAYKLVQDCAMQIWENKTTKTFEELLLESSSIQGKLNSAEISAIFNISYHTKHIDHIFKMVFSA